MFEKMCPHCLADGNFLEVGYDEKGRSFKLYGCNVCHNMTRVFDSPQTEREVVLVALVTDALRDNEIEMTRSEEMTIALVRGVIDSSIQDDVPEREKFVEDQMRLWTNEPRVWY